MCVEQLIEIFEALLTPVIAMVATYIAWQQWKTNQQKLNLERYDRRLRVYEEVRKILSIIGRDAKEVPKTFSNFAPPFLKQIFYLSWRSRNI